MRASLRSHLHSALRDGQAAGLLRAGVRAAEARFGLLDLRPSAGVIVEEVLDGVDYERHLMADPYGRIATIVHEAFHVHQDVRAPGRGANEQTVRLYPCLSVENNVGFVLEAEALAGVLADHVRTSVEYARALDVALGDAALAIVAKGRDALAPVLAWLASQPVDA